MTESSCICFTLGNGEASAIARTIAREITEGSLHYNTGSRSISNNGGDIIIRWH
jgi:ApbE superfamily uncharacterized protein (UPF0280 family)